MNKEMRLDAHKWKIQKRINQAIFWTLILVLIIHLSTYKFRIALFY